MKKIVVFDLDGTLLNTLESIAYCCNRALNDYGIQPLDISIYPNFIGRGARHLITQLTEYVKLDKEKFEEFFTHYIGIYEKHGSYNVAPYNEIPELIQALKDKGVKVGILSNKPDKIVTDCVEKYFPNSFNAVCGQKEGIPVKPDTTQLFQMLDSFDISAADAAFCGDSGVDIETGKNARMLTFGAAWGFYGEKPFASADVILHSPLEMLKYI